MYKGSVSEGAHSRKYQRNVDMSPHITPYLGLRSRLSQIWINRWTVLLFLILARILIAVADLNHNLFSAKTEALSACAGVESMGSALASMPHYLSSGVNELAAMGVERAVHGLMEMLLLSITAVEEIIVFYINMLTSTYACLITLAVRESLHTVLKTIEDVSDFVNTTLKDISSDIGSTVSGFESDLNKFTSALDSIPKAFGSNGGGIPQIDLTKQQHAMTTLQLPSGLDQGLTAINNSIPTFADVQNFTDSVIRFPFEQVKSLVNDSISFSFNRSVFPVPQKEQLTFCSDDNGIAEFFNHLLHTVSDARKIFVAAIVLLALAICIPMAIQEHRRWQAMNHHSRLVGDESLDPADVVYIVSRPYTATAGLKMAAQAKDKRSEILIRWVVAYATSTPALLLLALAITGLLSCLCQFILLKLVQREVPALAHEVGDFAAKVVNSLNNASEAWAYGTNGAIAQVNDEINKDVFGWVNTTTHAVNATLDTFINETTHVLNSTFGGTILYDPITEIFNCLIGLKVVGFEKGLTWVSNHARVDFPLLPNDTFSLGAASTKLESLNSKSDTTSAGDSKNLLDSPSPDTEATDKITSAVAKVTDHLENDIRTQALVSTAVLLVWVSVVFLGVGRALWLYFHSGQNPRNTNGNGASSVPLDSAIPLSEKSMPGPAPAYEPRSKQSLDSAKTDNSRTHEQHSLRLINEKE